MCRTLQCERFVFWLCSNLLLDASRRRHLAVMPSLAQRKFWILPVCCIALIFFRRLEFNWDRYANAQNGFDVHPDVPFGEYSTGKRWLNDGGLELTDESMRI